MKRNILILTFCLILPALLSAQTLYKAQKQMDKYNYEGAIVTLKKIADNPSKHNAALPMLAECYRMQHDILNAKSTYAEVVNLPEAKPEAFYYYAQALQSVGDYTKARQMYQEYSEKNPSDLRGPLFVMHCDSVLGPWKLLKPKFEAKLARNINTTESDFGPVLYDGNLIYASDHNYDPANVKEYKWTGRGFLKLMQSVPATAGSFGPEMGSATAFEAKFDQEYHDGPATFSADENIIYLTRSYLGKAKREGIYKTNTLKIYSATKTNGTWGELKPFYLNSLDYSVGHPALSLDGKTLYFVSDMPGGIGGTDIWKCELENDAWGKAVNLGSTINTTENEMFPSIASDGSLYFSSEGLPGYGALDVFKTKFVNGNWTTPENLHTPINGSFDDFAIAFTPGMKNGFFSSNRFGGVGNDDIYSFKFIEQAPEIEKPSAISGVVLDKTTMKPLAGATVFVLDPTTEEIRVLKTSSDGKYNLDVNKPADFVVKAMNANYIADCIHFPVTDIKPGTTISAPQDLLLDKLEVNRTFKIENIYYNFDKYDIRDDAKPELDKLVRIMKENEITVELGSYTDSRGSFEYNDKLSQHRAESAVAYIISQGIDKNRITAKGYGEHQLTNNCADGVNCTPEEHQANRRTEFKIISLVKNAGNTDNFDAGNYYDGQQLTLKMLPADFYKPCK